MTDRDIEKVRQRIKANNVRIAQQKGLPHYERDLLYIQSMEKRNVKLTKWLKSKKADV